MFRNILFIVLILFGTLLTAQEKDRVMVQGKIIVPEGESSEGMTVFNKNTTSGTISNQEGEFNLKVALGDSIMFSAIQFQKFAVVVEEGVINSGEMNVFLTETVNELPEVRLSSNELSGDINVDVAKIKVTNPEVPAYSAAELKAMGVNVTPDALTGPGRNAALAAGNTRLVNGLNFVNIFKLIAGAEIENNPFSEKELDEKLRTMYNDDFFKSNLNIERDKINDFIYYLTDHGLNKKMLADGNELNLIEFLIEKGEDYKALQTQD